MASNKAKRNALIKETGSYCWFCQKKFNEEDLSLHHIIPRRFRTSMSKSHYILACKKCHANVHKYDFGSVEYMFFTLQALDFYRKMSNKSE